MTAASTSDARKRNTSPVDPVEVVEAVQRAHRIECTGLGEVTCAGDRSLGWMSWHAYHGHIAADVVAALRENGFTL